MLASLPFLFLIWSVFPSGVGASCKTSVVLPFYWKSVSRDLDVFFSQMVYNQFRFLGGTAQQFEIEVDE